MSSVDAPTLEATGVSEMSGNIEHASTDCDDRPGLIENCSGCRWAMPGANLEQETNLIPDPVPEITVSA